jgi:hypothetical protein
VAFWRFLLSRFRFRDITFCRPSGVEGEGPAVVARERNMSTKMLRSKKEKLKDRSDGLEELSSPIAAFYHSPVCL